MSRALTTRLGASRWPLPELAVVAALLVAPFVLPWFGIGADLMGRILIWGLFGIGFDLLFGYTASCRSDRPRSMASAASLPPTC